MSLDRNVNFYVLTVAALAVAVYFFNQNSKLIEQVKNCELKFEGFKEGVIYVK